MKLLITLPLLLLASIASHSQEKKTAPYLIVRMVKIYDLSNKREFMKVYAEGGNDAAKPLYELLNYDPKKNALNNAGVFYFEHKDTAAPYYNYFLTPTQALNFIADQRWVIVSIYPEISSGSEKVSDDKSNNVPITTIQSMTVYCFKRDE